MTNHPNRSRSYWWISPRGFANEYTVGIATTRAHGDQYKAEGYDRITRERALRELSDRGDDATQIFAGVSIDGREAHWIDRFTVARCIRHGLPIT